MTAVRRMGNKSKKEGSSGMDIKDKNGGNRIRPGDKSDKDDEDNGTLQSNKYSYKGICGSDGVELSEMK